MKINFNPNVLGRRNFNTPKRNKTKEQPAYKANILPSFDTISFQKDPKSVYVVNKDGTIKKFSSVKSAGAKYCTSHSLWSNFKQNGGIYITKENIFFLEDKIDEKYKQENATMEPEVFEKYQDDKSKNNLKLKQCYLVNQDGTIEKFSSIAQLSDRINMTGGYISKRLSDDDDVTFLKGSLIFSADTLDEKYKQKDAKMEKEVFVDYAKKCNDKKTNPRQKIFVDGYIIKIDNDADKRQRRAPSTPKQSSPKQTNTKQVDTKKETSPQTPAKTPTKTPPGTPIKTQTNNDNKQVTIDIKPTVNISPIKDIKIIKDGEDDEDYDFNNGVNNKDETIDTDNVNDIDDLDELDETTKSQNGIYVFDLKGNFRRFKDANEAAKYLNVPVEDVFKSARSQLVGVRGNRFKCAFSLDVEYINDEGKVAPHKRLLSLIVNNFCEDSFYVIRLHDHKMKKFNSFKDASITLGMDERIIISMLNNHHVQNKYSNKYAIVPSRELESPDDNGIYQLDKEKLNDFFESKK